MSNVTRYSQGWKNTPEKNGNVSNIIRVLLQPLQYQQYMPNVTRYSQGWKNTLEKLAIWICFILTTDQNMGININYKVFQEG